jgi:acyl dehydratase
MASRIEPYRLQAYNTAKDSENKMHDDTVAKQFGFRGGLVTGVDLLAYMIHIPVAKWGRAFLERGAIEGRFLKPVYDGEMLAIEADETDNAILLRLLSRGEVCATGGASLPAHVPAVDTESYKAVPPVAARIPVDETSYPVEGWLGTAPQAWSAADAANYAHDVRDTEALYGHEGLVHPGVIQRLMNRVLVENAVLGPWIHVGSQMQLLAPVKIGDELSARARVTANYERKGHRFVEFDAIAVANGRTAVAQCHHIAITQPRRERAAA